MKQSEQIEQRKTASLIPYARNARTHSESQVALIAGSIREFGFTNPVLVWRDEIVAGHGRVLAAQKLGMETVPCVSLDHLTDTQRRAYVLADNRLAELSGWDDEMQANELAALAEDGVALEMLGFDAEEDIEAEEPEDSKSDDEVPEPPAVATTQRGDLWLLGQHRLLCGDCREAGDVATLLAGAKIDIAFTSPPYAAQREYDASSGFKPIRPDEYVAWFEAVQARVREHLAETGSWFVNIKEHCEDGKRHLYVKDLTIAHVRQWGWSLIDEFCWLRGGVPGKWPNRFKNAWEPCFHFARGTLIKLRHENVQHASADCIDYSPDNTKTHSGFISGSAGRRDGLALPSNVVEAHSSPAQIASELDIKHTATFPVALPTFFIKAFTDAGDVVFDPFMGSGTTLVAAEKTGRAGYGTEISGIYCDLIVQRWQMLTGQAARLESSGESFDAVAARRKAE